MQGFQCRQGTLSGFYGIPHLIKCRLVFVEVPVSIVEDVRDSLPQSSVLELNHNLTGYILYLLMTTVIPTALFSDHFQVMGNRPPSLFASL